jgi:1-acyl-sn-glycerol-3-phosphate acyltransferase
MKDESGHGNGVALAMAEAAAAAPAPALEGGGATPLPTFTQKTWLYNLFQQSLRGAALTFYDLKTYGLENIPKRGGVLIVANHQSFLDPVMLGANIRRPVSFLAKSELFSNPFFGRLLRRLNAFPVRQGEGDVGAVRETIKRLQEGHLLTMFPEGGRTLDGKIAPLEKGVGLIVRRAGPQVMVLPAAVCGAYEAWPRGVKWPKTGRVRVKYGTPMHLADRKATDVINVIDREIRRLFEELKTMPRASV